MAISKVSNIQWLSANSGKKYPLDDISSGVDDLGDSMLTNIVTDLNIWFPGDSNSDRACISSVRVSRSLVTVTISAAGSDFVPLAAITVPKPVIPFRNYALSTYKDNTYGWICFDDAVNSMDEVTFKFDPSQNNSLISPRAATAYKTTGVTSIKKKSLSEKLTGLVSVISGTPDELVIEKQTRTLPGIGEVEALVFRLNEDVAGPDIYSKFLGECDVSPDSGTCKRDEIYSINEVVPDCAGVIKLIFDEVEDPSTGQLLITNLYEGRGLLDFGLGYTELCRRFGIELQDELLTKCEDACEKIENDLGPFDGYTQQYEEPLP